MAGRAVSFDTVANGEKNYCVSLIENSQYNIKAVETRPQFQNHVKYLAAKVKEIIGQIESKSKQSVVKYSIERTGVTKQRELSFERKNPSTWNFEGPRGIDSLWDGFKLRGYDGMVIFAIFTNEDIPAALWAHEIDQQGLCEIYEKAVCAQIKKKHPGISSSPSAGMTGKCTGEVLYFAFQLGKLPTTTDLSKKQPIPSEDESSSSESEDEKRPAKKKARKRKAKTEKNESEHSSEEEKKPKKNKKKSSAKGPATVKSQPKIVTAEIHSENNVTAGNYIDEDCEMEDVVDGFFGPVKTKDLHAILTGNGIPFTKNMRKLALIKLVEKLGIAALRAEDMRLICLRNGLHVSGPKVDLLRRIQQKQ